MLAFTFIVLATMTISSTLVQALNDWSVPCTSGTCEININGDQESQADANYRIHGDERAISDISPAAGWKMLGCNSTWSDGDHNVTMVCAGTPDQMAHCDHVNTGGVEHTVVRLPQNCGTGPFARMKKMYKAEDQSVPIHIKRQLIASNVTEPPVVFVAELDYNFTDIPPNHAKLNYALTTSHKPHSLPPTKRSMSLPPLKGRKRAIHERGLFGDIGKAVTGAAKDAASAVSHGAVSGASAVSHGAVEGASAVSHGAVAGASAISTVATEGASVVSTAAKEGASVISSVATEAASVISSVAVSDVGKGLSAAASFVSSVGVETEQFLTAEHNLTKINNDIAINFVKNFTMIDTTISCHDFKNNVDAHIKIGVDANVNATLGFGVIMAGKIIPPTVEQFSAFSNMEGDADFVIHLGFEVVGTFDTQFVSLFKIGLPGLSLPGLGKIGPILNVGLRMQVDVNMVSQIDVHVAVRMDGVHMSFPPGSGDNSAQATPSNVTNSLQLSTANGGLDAQGSINASFIPRLEIGLDTPMAKAFVFVDVELGAVLAMNGDAGNTTAANATNASANATTAVANDASVNATSDATDVSTNATATDATDASANATTTDATDASANATTADATDASTNATVASGADAANATISSAVADGGNATDSSQADQSDQSNVDPAGDDTADVASDASDDTTAASTDVVTPTDAGSTAAASSPADATLQSGGAGASLLPRAINGGRSISLRDKRTVNLARHLTRNLVHSKRQDNGSIPDNDTTVGNLVPASPNGCITVTTVFSVNAGLSGTLVPLFTKSFTYPIFHTSHQVFQTCFNGATVKAVNPHALVGAKAVAAAAAAAAANDTDSTDGTDDGTESTDGADDGTDSTDGTGDDTSTDAGTTDASTDDASSNSTAAGDNAALTRRHVRGRAFRVSRLPRNDDLLRKRQIIPFAAGLGGAGIGGPGGAALAGLSSIGTGPPPNFNAIQNAIISALICPSNIQKFNALTPLLTGI